MGFYLKRAFFGRGGGCSGITVPGVDKVFFFLENCLETIYYWREFCVSKFWKLVHVYYILELLLERRSWKTCQQIALSLSYFSSGFFSVRDIFLVVEWLIVTCICYCSIFLLLITFLFLLCKWPGRKWPQRDPTWDPNRRHTSRKLQKILALYSACEASKV